VSWHSKEVTGDDCLHDLGGAIADLEANDITEPLIEVVVTAVARPAMQTERCVDGIG
jgi:hypothetical protein